MILLSDKKKEFSIPEIGDIHNQLNNWYIQNVFACQNSSKEYQDILSKFTIILSELFDLIQDLKRYNNNALIN